MTGIDSYSTTPATNATCDAGAINYAEGMPPSAVNNSARQALADIRSAFNDLAWFQYSTGNQGAGNIAVPAVYSSGTVFTIAGADVTAAYHVGRRVRAVGSATGTIYGSIITTSYAPTTTTVTVTWDSGSLSNETLVISLSQIPVTGVPLAGPIHFPAAGIASSNANTLDDYEEGTWTPSDGSGAALSFTITRAGYIKVGGLLFIDLTIVYPVTANGANAAITGLPFLVPNTTGIGGAFAVYDGVAGAIGVLTPNTATFTINGLTGTAITNATLSTQTIRAQFSYFAPS